MDHDDNDDDNEERRQAELEFVTAAYRPDEAWCEPSAVPSRSPIIHRRIVLRDDAHGTSVPLRLSLTLVPGYPSQEELPVLLQVDSGPASSSCSSSSLLKLVYDESVLTSLRDHCRSVASSVPGQEAVFLVLTAAEEWVQETWPSILLASVSQSQATTPTTSTEDPLDTPNKTRIWGRRLIYSHHIIAPSKRNDLQSLARQYQLSGYVKIGWPGIIVMEGWEDACQDFYDEIRQWSWQYLVVRGEMQQAVLKDDNDDETTYRRFPHGLQEVDDMSIVANACREADLEALFKTSMKIYDNSTSSSESNDTMSSNKVATTTRYQGVLLYVDHMNDGKGYRKWLRQTAAALHLVVVMRHVGRTVRGPFVVALVAPAAATTRSTTSLMLKRWRSSRVDVNAQGKPCVERQMHVMVEGDVLEGDNDKTNKNSANHPPEWTDPETWFQQQQTTPEGEAHVYGDSREQVVSLMRFLGSKVWAEAVESVFPDRGAGGG